MPAATTCAAVLSSSRAAAAGIWTHPLGRWVKRRIRSAVVLAAHAVGFALVYLGAYLIRHEGAVPPLVWRRAVGLLPLVVSVRLLAVVMLSGHRGWWRYATVADLVNVAEAASIGSVALGLAHYFLAGALPVSLSILVIDWAGVLVVLCGGRALSRLVRELGRGYVRGSAQPLERVLVVGAGEAG
jgi:FlaA1/EpsC-like NDP-sugar epimerase